MEKSQKNRSDKSRSPWRTFGSVYKRDVHLLDGTVTVTAESFEMFPSIVSILFAALALLQVSSAVDISKYKNIRLEFTSSDGETQTKLLGDDRGAGFIGDFSAGQRYSDEIIFRRVVEFENPTNMVQSTTLNLSVSNAIIHYVSARNAVGSYAVVCNESNSLGSSKGSITLRVPPNSTSSLTLLIAAHSQLRMI